jgi:hypothetical protein
MRRQGGRLVYRLSHPGDRKVRKHQSLVRDLDILLEDIDKLQDEIDTLEAA